MGVGRDNRDPGVLMGHPKSRLWEIDPLTELDDAAEQAPAEEARLKPRPEKERPSIDNAG